MKDLTGMVFGRLKVLEFVGGEKYAYKWKCLCACGSITVVRRTHLKSGHTKSCGCWNLEQGKIHGMWNAPEYKSFQAARSRCQNQRDKDYPRYGGAGIEFRFESFHELLEEIGPKPGKGYSIDRINNEGHYEKGNVRWATAAEQNRNLRNNVRLEFDGKSLITADWSDLTGIKRSTIDRRYRAYKWCVACTLTIKTRKGNCTHKRL